MVSQRLASYAEFFPYYLSEHRHPVCRALHYIGTALSTLIGVFAAITLNPWLIPAGLICGYAFAWVGHFFIERNRPATFTYPLWSLIGDYHMLALKLTGRLPRAMVRARQHYP